MRIDPVKPLLAKCSDFIREDLRTQTMALICFIHHEIVVIHDEIPGGVTGNHTGHCELTMSIKIGGYITHFETRTKHIDF